MNWNAAVRFLVTRNSLANVLNRCSVSAADGGGLIATHGGGAATDCLSARTLAGGSCNAEAGEASAVRRGTTNTVHMLAVGVSNLKSAVEIGVSGRC